MAVQSYKCPSCGAGISFKPDLQKFRCDYCLSEYTEREINELTKTIQDKPEKATDKATDKGNLKEEGKEQVAREESPPANHLASYDCNSCGAQVVTDDTTTATFCYFCHNPVIISDRLSGSFKPNKMIPFTIDKEKAQETFLKWVGRNKYVPKEFYSNSQLEKITGIYLPYWWADCKIEVDYEGQGSSVKTWESGDEEYTETKKYQIVRKGSININNVEELAFTKIEKNLLDGIAPYDETKAVEFSMPYLSGFFAEQYDIPKEEITPKIEDQVYHYARTLIRETLSDYTSVADKSNKTEILSKTMNYTLLPAWVLTYQYQGKTYVFAVNGQTGKSFGELPMSTKKVFGLSAAIFAVASLALLLGGILIW